MHLFRPQAGYEDDQPASWTPMAGFETFSGVYAVRHHLGAAGGTQGVLVHRVSDFRPAPHNGTTTDWAVSRLAANAQVGLSET